MVRVKAPPAAPTATLNGVTVTFASYSATCHPDFASKTVTQLKVEIANCGGSYASKLDQCTHLIASPAQFEKKLKLVKEALQQPDVTIVTYEWLAESLKSSSPITVDPYLLDQSSATPAVANGINNTSGSGGADVDSESDIQASTVKSKPNLKRKRGKNTVPAANGSSTPVSTQKLPAKAKPVLKIPVDEVAATGGFFTVFVDDDGLAWDATLSQSNASDNNNKFYKLQILVDQRGDVRCWTRWGRVGEKGQFKMLGTGDLDGAKREFEKKFKDKNGNAWANRDGPIKPGKYVYIEINYAESDDEDGDESKPRKKKAAIQNGASQEEEEEEEEGDITPVECTLDKPVQELMELIFNLKLFDSTMAALNYDATKMPLGKLSKKTLLKGYEVLKELASLIADPTTASGLGVSYGDAVSTRSNLYFSLVPHVSGRNRLPTLDNIDLIKVSFKKHSCLVCTS